MEKIFRDLFDAVSFLLDKKIAENKHSVDSHTARGHLGNILDGKEKFDVETGGLVPINSAPSFADVYGHPTQADIDTANLQAAKDEAAKDAASQIMNSTYHPSDASE